MIMFLSDMTLSVILVFPLIVLYIRITNFYSFQYKENILNLLTMIIFVNFMLIKFLVQIGDLFFIQLINQVIITIAAIGALYYLWKIDIKAPSKWFGLKSKQVIILSVLGVSCLIVTFVGTSYKNKMVIEHHQGFLTSVAESEDPSRFVLYNSRNPASVMSYIPYFKEFKDSNFVNVSIDFTGKRIVSTKSNGVTLEFTYERVRNGWVLDGIYKQFGLLPSDTPLEDE